MAFNLNFCIMTAQTLTSNESVSPYTRNGNEPQVLIVKDADGVESFATGPNGNSAGPIGTIAYTRAVNVGLSESAGNGRTPYFGRITALSGLPLSGPPIIPSIMTGIGDTLAYDFDYSLGLPWIADAPTPSSLGSYFPGYPCFADGMRVYDFSGNPTDVAVGTITDSLSGGFVSAYTIKSPTTNISPIESGVFSLGYQGNNIPVRRIAVTSAKTAAPAGARFFPAARWPGVGSASNTATYEFVTNLTSLGDPYTIAASAIDPTTFLVECGALDWTILPVTGYEVAFSWEQDAATYNSTAETWSFAPTGLGSTTAKIGADGTGWEMSADGTKLFLYAMRQGTGAIYDYAGGTNPQMLSPVSNRTTGFTGLTSGQAAALASSRFYSDLASTMTIYVWVIPLGSSNLKPLAGHLFGLQGAMAVPAGGGSPRLHAAISMTLVSVAPGEPEVVAQATGFMGLQVSDTETFDCYPVRHVASPTGGDTWTPGEDMAVENLDGTPIEAGLTGSDTIVELMEWAGNPPELQIKSTSYPGGNYKYGGCAPTQMLADERGQLYVNGVFQFSDYSSNTVNQLLWKYARLYDGGTWANSSTENASTAELGTDNAQFPNGFASAWAGRRTQATNAGGAGQSHGSGSFYQALGGVGFESEDAGETWAQMSPAPQQPQQGQALVCLRGESWDGLHVSLDDFATIASAVSAESDGTVLFPLCGSPQDVCAFATVNQSTGAVSLKVVTVDPLRDALPAAMSTGITAYVGQNSQPVLAGWCWRQRIVLLVRDMEDALTSYVSADGGASFAAAVRTYDGGASWRAA